MCTYSKLRDECAELFKREMGCLHDVELEVEFKSEATVQSNIQEAMPCFFCRLRRCGGIARSVWTSTQFNHWGTPVFPVCKLTLRGSDKARLRVLGDCSVAINPRLAVHCHPL